MRAFVPILLAGVVFFAGCASQPKTASNTGEPGFLGRMWNSMQKLNPFDRGIKPREMKERGPVNLKSLAVQVVVDPAAPKLSEDRVMTVSLRVTNKAKKRTHLEFSTTQRVEAVIKDKSGRVIERWSDDHRFEKEPGLVAINPGERAEYNLSVATREMSAGETYTVEAFVVGYEGLHGSAAVTPVK